MLLLLCRAQSYAERLRLGLAVIHGEAQCTEQDMDDGRHSPPTVKNTTLHTGLELPRTLSPFPVFIFICLVKQESLPVFSVKETISAHRKRVVAVRRLIMSQVSSEILNCMYLPRDSLSIVYIFASIQL